MPSPASCRSRWTICLAIVVCARVNALAQAPADDTISVVASAHAYVVPDDGNYVQPTLRVDRGWLHVEARYNYEALDSGSAWSGYNFSGGQSLEWTFTPMLGGVCGDVAAVAVGYNGSLSWWKLELYSEGEQLFDTGDSSDSFFYNWSELALAPVDHFRVGLVSQRTRAYRSDREIQRGALIGATYKKLDMSAYVFNPDDDERTLVVALGLSL